MTTEFHEAIAQEVVWKNDEIRHFAVELVSRALEQTVAGAQHFTTDIVPDAERGTGTGIAGSVVELLKNANVLEPVGIWSGGKWYPEREKSTRPGCKARYLCVLKLKSRAMAETFLRRNAEGRMKNAETFVEQELAIS